MSLFAELKRRNVIRVAGAYLALGWIVTQITATVAEVLSLPGWVAPAVLWFGVAGFPFALLFSWAYELTPEGLKREHEVERNDSITRVTAKRLDVITIAMVAIAIGLYLVDPIGMRRSEPGLAPQAAQPSAASTPAVPAAAPAVEPSVDPRSIAVLPFVDMSAGKDQDYMSDGIAEELLNLLARIPELKVTSRSSAFAFKGEKIDIGEVARKLNVAHVLEGSVRTSGNRVRITAQLIDARADQHLWSQSYDRTVDDIFAVQDEIAGAVVEQLKIKLLGEAPKTRVTDPKAYALFLQARELGRVMTPEAFEQSNAMLKRVLEIDPGYAEAWERLGTNYINEIGDILPQDQAFEMAREAYRKALEIDPELVSGLDGIAWIEMLADGDLAAAARDYTRVLALAPGNLDLISNASRLLQCLGRTAQAVPVLEYAATRDPGNPIGLVNLADAYLRTGRVDDSIAVFRTHLGLGRERFGAAAALGTALLLDGDHAGALAAIQQEAAPKSRQFGLALTHHSLGQRAEADAAAKAFIDAESSTSPYQVARLHAWRGDNDAAFEWLERAAANHSRGLCGVTDDPLLQSLHADPRWQPVLRKYNRAPEQLAAIPFEVKVPM